MSGIDHKSQPAVKPVVFRALPWRWIYSFFCRDFWRKAIALFFAVLVYYAVRQQISEVQTVSGVPVEIVLPAGLVNANPKPVTVTLTVRGSRRDLQSRIKPVGRVEVDENRFISGKSYRIELAPSDFTSSNGIQVIGIDDRDRVQELPLQRRITRILPVLPSFVGQLSPDYVRGEVHCVPDSVEVTGPEKTVSALKEMTTEDIPLDSTLTESFSYSTRLVNPHGLLVAAKDDSVQVQVSIEKNYQDRRFASVPVALLTSPGVDRKLRYELLNPGMVEIELRGLKRAVSTLPRAGVRPYLDMEKFLEPGVYDVPVGCYLGGSDIEVKQVIPPSIKVKVSK